MWVRVEAHGEVSEEPPHAVLRPRRRRQRAGAQHGAAAGQGTAAYRRADHRDLRPSKFSMILCRWLMEILKIIDVPSSVEQVIAVPRISCPSRPLRVQEEGDVGTVLGRRWPSMVPLRRATGGLLVEVGRTYRPVGPPRGSHRQPRTVYKYWPRMTWCTSGRRY